MSLMPSKRYSFVAQVEKAHDAYVLADHKYMSLMPSKRYSFVAQVEKAHDAYVLADHKLCLHAYVYYYKCTPYCNICEGI